MADVEDLLTEAQDYFFEGNLPEAERLCKQVLALKPSEGDAYSLLCVMLSQQNKFSDAAEVAKNWGKNSGYTPGQLRIQAENSFMVGDAAGVRFAAEKLLNHRWKDPVGVFVRTLLAALSADIGERTLAGNLLNSCEGENMEEDEEVLVDLFVAWTETRIGNDRRKIGIEALKKVLTSDNVHYRGLATALLVLDHINEGTTGEAEGEIAEEFKNNNDDANLAGVRALLVSEKNGETNEEWKRNVEKAVAASNVLIKRQISVHFIFTYFLYVIFRFFFFIIFFFCFCFLFFVFFYILFLLLFVTY